MRLNPVPPFVWPEARIFTKQAEYESQVPLQQLMARADGILAVVSDIDRCGARWLHQTLKRETDVAQCRIIVVLYAACATKEGDLQALVDIEAETPDRVEFRLHLTGLWSALPANILYFMEPGRAEGTLCVGSSPNFGWGEPDPGMANLVFHPDLALTDAWRKWFDWLWLTSAPLTAETAAIPSLVPALGTPEAAQIWARYEEACRLARTNAGLFDEVQVTVDPSTGAVTAATPDGEPVVPPTENLGIPKPDPVAERIARLYDHGAMVTIDKATRSRPLDAPMKPQWFGVESLRQIGAVTREVKYRISIMDKDVLQKLESRRKATRDLLNSFSYPLAEGVRWMPHTARGLFESEMARVNQEGLELLSKVVGDPDQFVGKQCERISRDANQMYQEFAPGRELPQSVIEEIMADLAARLREATKGHLLPHVTYTPVRFAPVFGSEWSDAWGQAAILLAAIAEYPRRAVSDAFFLRGLKVDKKELLRCMNVCDDAMLRKSGHNWVETDPEEQIRWLDTVVDSEAEPAAKCACILAIVDGKPWERVECILANSADASAARNRAEASGSLPIPTR